MAFCTRSGFGCDEISGCLMLSFGISAVVGDEGIEVVEGDDAVPFCRIAFCFSSNCLRRCARSSAVNAGSLDVIDSFGSDVDGIVDDGDDEEDVVDAFLSPELLLSISIVALCVTTEVPPPDPPLPFSLLLPLSLLFLSPIISSPPLYNRIF